MQHTKHHRLKIKEVGFLFWYIIGSNITKEKKRKKKRKEFSVVIYLSRGDSQGQVFENLNIRACGIFKVDIL